MLQENLKIGEKETKISPNSFTLTQALLAFLVCFLSPKLWVVPPRNHGALTTVHPIFRGRTVHPKHVWVS